MAVVTGRARARRMLAVVGTLAVVSVGSAGVAAAPAGASTEKIQRAQALALLAFVPESSRATCNISDVTADTPVVGPFADKVLVQLACGSASDEESVFYTQFDGSEAMNAAFDAYNVGVAESDGCPGHGTWDQDGEDAGRWTCYLGKVNAGVTDPATVVWTQDANDILVAAYRHDDDLAALDEWWSSDDAGPLAEADHSNLPKTLTTTQWLANAKTLKAVAPRSFRSTCKPIALTPDAMGATFYAWRAVATAGLRCHPDGVVAVEYLQLAPVAPGASATAGIFGDFASEVDDSDARFHDSDFACEGEGTWSRKQRDVGRYACFFGTGDHGDYTGIAWTDEEQGILAYATVDGSNAESLLGFWEDDSGPLVAR